MLSNPHNLNSVPQNEKQPYGIHISLAENDPFRRLVAENWEVFHWFTNAADRDATLADMSRRHEYSRRGDVPTLRYKPVER